MEKDEMAELRRDLQFIAVWLLEDNLSDDAILVFVRDHAREFNMLYERHPHLWCCAYKRDKVRTGLIMRKKIEALHAAHTCAA